MKKKTAIKEKPIVLDRSFDIQNHQWVQRGYQLECNSCQYRHGITIPPGKMLSGQKGKWQLIDE